MVEDKKEFNKIDLEGVDGLEKIKPENLEKIDRNFEKHEDFEVKKREILNDIVKKEGEGEIGGIVNVGNRQVQMIKRQKEIEDVLSQDLSEIYLKMPEDKKREFKKKGEETAMEINTMLDSAKFKIKKIIDLIRKWLSIIPGMNKFFLEQETKIKTDEILKLKNKIA